MEKVQINGVTSVTDLAAALYDSRPRNRRSNSYKGIYWRAEGKRINLLFSYSVRDTAEKIYDYGFSVKKLEKISC